MMLDDTQPSDGTESQSPIEIGLSYFHTGEPPIELIQAVQEYNIIENSPNVLMANIVQLRKRHCMRDIVASIREGMNDAQVHLEQMFKDVTDDEYAELETCALGQLDRWRLGSELRHKYGKLENLIGVRRCFQNALVFGVGDFHVKVEPFPEEYIESSDFLRLQQSFISYIQQIHFVVNEEPFHIIFDRKDLSYDLFRLQTSTAKVKQVLEIFQSSISQIDQLVTVEIPRICDLQTSYAPKQDYCFSYFIVKLRSERDPNYQGNSNIERHEVDPPPNPAQFVGEEMPNEQQLQHTLPKISLTRIGSDITGSFSEIATPSEMSSDEEEFTSFTHDAISSNYINRVSVSEMTSTTEDFSDTGSNADHYALPEASFGEVWNVKVPLTGAIPRDYLRDLLKYSNRNLRSINKDCFICEEIPYVWKVVRIKQRYVQGVFKKSGRTIVKGMGYVPGYLKSTSIVLFYVFAMYFLLIMIIVCAQVFNERMQNKAHSRSYPTKVVYVTKPPESFCDPVFKDYLWYDAFCKEPTWFDRKRKDFTEWFDEISREAEKSKRRRYH
ncbi:uncharacterized protein J8A68_005163 [[Candida] subhashii]|uniref:Uncharacterized protein n=1 Tax=[Candida] subhashii TaxID=561895 RepID=A0A8J5Q7I6_9ASCO|nr:uncharacterized protein J8A68_005163 [[Candida] subhashii]KAG7661371.1 hypothetical protein J8A68_005163 [[Candida] subhashii]